MAKPTRWLLAQEKTLAWRGDGGGLNHPPCYGWTVPISGTERPTQGSPGRITEELKLGGASTRPPLSGGPAVSVGPAPVPSPSSSIPLSSERLFPAFPRPHRPLLRGGPRSQSLPISILTHTSGCCSWLRNKHITPASQSEPFQVPFFFFFGQSCWAEALFSRGLLSWKFWKL